MCWRRLSATMLIVASSTCLPLAVAGVLDLGTPAVTAAGFAGLLVAGAVLRTAASRRIRAEQAGLVYLLGSRLAAAEEARQRDAEILHELRSTVQGVSSASRLLTERATELSGEVMHRLESLRQAELARLERLLAQNNPARVHPVAVDDVVRPLVDSVELRGHDIVWEPSDLSVLGRPDDVAEIVHVLLENAVRHAPGSTITLSADRTYDRVIVTVHDTGPGIPRPFGHRVFDRGVRSETSVGEGLGLSAARRLARQMRGELRLVDGWTAGGTAFALDLPAAGAEMPCARSA